MRASLRLPAGFHGSGALPGLAAALVLLWAAAWLPVLWRRACLPGPSALQNRRQALAPLDRENALGQSLAVQPARLGTFSVYAEVTRPGSPITLTARLRRSPDDPHDLAVAQAATGRWLASQRVDFIFPARLELAAASYYLLVQSSAAPGDLALWTSRQDADTRGQMYTNGAPAGVDLAYRLCARPGPRDLALAALARPLRWGWALGLLAGLAGTGGLCLYAAGALPSGGLVERILYAQAAGLSAVILWMAGLGLAGLPAGRPAALVSAAILAVLVGLRRLRGLRRSHPRSRDALDEQISARRPPVLSAPHPSPSWVSPALAALVLLSIASRLAQVNPFDLPLWVDGLNHQEILAKMAASGGLPWDSLYHKGFHALALAIHELTGAGLPEISLLAGAYLSALAGPAVYLLAAALGFSTPAALAGAMLLAFFAPFPAALISWSRYPFLLGLALLPPAAAAWTNWARNPRGAPWLAALLLAGLALAHTGALLIALAWIALLGIEKMAGAARSRGRPGPRSQPGLAGRAAHRPPAWLLGFLAALLPAVLLLLPRLALMIATPEGAAFLARLARAEPDFSAAELASLSLGQGGALVWSLALAGLLAGLGRRIPGALRLAAWVALLGLGWAAQLLLGSLQPLSAANLVFFLALPAALLAGLAVDKAAAAAIRPLSRWVRPPSRAGAPWAWLAGFGPGLAQAVFLAAALLAGAAALWAGLGQAAGAIFPLAIDFSPEDRQAFAWIEQNTPSNAAFLVSSSPWGDRFRPDGGGGWLETLTGRPTRFLTGETAFASLPEDLARAPVDFLYLHRSDALSQAVASFPEGYYPLVYANPTIEIRRVLPSP